MIYCAKLTSCAGQEDLHLGRCLADGAHSDSGGAAGSPSTTLVSSASWDDLAAGDFQSQGSILFATSVGFRYAGHDPLYLVAIALPWGVRKHADLHCPISFFFFLFFSSKKGLY